MYINVYHKYENKTVLLDGTCQVKPKLDFGGQGCRML